MRTVLTIAGSDPSGGAGIQGDLKTFAALGVYGMAAITALTVQNTTTVSRVVAVDATLVGEQIDAVLTDIAPDAIKIGMLANASVVRAVAEVLTHARASRPGLPIVLDPVMSATAGGALLDDEGVRALVATLVPLATVVTPNLTEAMRLTGEHVVDRVGAQRAATAIVALGAQAAVVTGGHLDGPPIDVLVDAAGRTTEITSERIDTLGSHGTGCAYASALASRLALGDDLATAARAAHVFVAGALRRAPRLGQGHGPVGHS